MTRDERIVAAAKRLTRARLAHREAKAALRRFREEHGGCEVSDRPTSCFQVHGVADGRRVRLPLTDWCATCQASEPLWLAARSAGTAAAASLRGLQRLCATEDAA